MTQIAPDGSPVEVYRALPARDEPGLIHAALPAGSHILELGCGVGRITRELVALGHRVVAVDQSPEMIAHVKDVETVLADIETLALDRRFDGVVLASHLVNTTEEAQRAAFLATCARHVAPDGRVLVQRLDPTGAWAPGVYHSMLGPVKMALRIIRRQANVMVAAIDYVVGSRTFTQAFSAEILDDETTQAAFERAGLTLDRYLDPTRTWASARLSA